MNSGRKAWAAALGAALLLSGCGALLQQRAPLPLAAPEPPRQLTFQVGSSLGREILDQADRFADNLEKVSGGRMLVEVTVGPANQETVASGQTDLCILTGPQVAQLDPVFSMLQMPFLYDGYRHMEMALNSGRMQERLAKRLEEYGVVPLAAVAEQGDVLVCSGEAIRVPSDFRGRAVAMRTDTSGKLAVFEALGARVLPYTQQDVSQRLGEQVEILPEDLSQKDDQVQIDTVEASFGQVLALPPQPEQQLYMVNSCHNIAPLWVVANRDCYRSMDTQERAWLLEGCAALTAGIDLAREARESRALAAIREQGLRIVDLERQDLALWLYGSKGEGSDLYPIPENFDPELYRLIQEYAQ